MLVTGVCLHITGAVLEFILIHNWANIVARFLSGKSITESRISLLVVSNTSFFLFLFFFFSAKQLNSHNNKLFPHTDIA